MNQPLLAVNVEQKLATVTFCRNSDIQAAFDLLLTAVPTKWADRGRLSYRIYPLDDDYGDPLGNGMMSVAWSAP